MNAMMSQGNPFAAMIDPQRVLQAAAQSMALRQLEQRLCRPLDRAVIRCASAELAEWDGRIDRKTVYLAPGQTQPPPRRRRRRR